MEAALLAGIGALSTSVLLHVLEQRYGADPNSAELQFGRDLTPETTELVIDHLAGLHRGARVALDVQADTNGVRYFLHTD